MPTYKQAEPKSNASYFVKPGTYAVEVVKAIEKESNAGNPMIRLEVQILLGKDSLGPIIWDHLVFVPKASWKIDQFLASTGSAVIEGEETNIEADGLVGLKGVAVIGEEPGEKNPDQRFNTLERWVFGDERKKWIDDRRQEIHVKAKANAHAPKEVEDDIPF
jgi:hypothetical protein